MRIGVVLGTAVCTVASLAWACSSSVEGSGDPIDPGKSDGGTEPDRVDISLIECPVLANAAADCTDRTTDRYLYRAGDGGAGVDAAPEPTYLPEQPCLQGRRYDFGCTRQEKSLEVAAGPLGKGYALASGLNDIGLRTYDIEGNISESQGFLDRMRDAQLLAGENNEAWVVGSLSSRAHPTRQVGYYPAPMIPGLYLEEGITTQTELRYAGFTGDGMLVTLALERSAENAKDSAIAITRDRVGAVKRSPVELTDEVQGSPFGAFVYRKVEGGVAWGPVGSPPTKTATATGFFDRTATYFLDKDRPPAYVVPSSAPLGSRPAAYAIFFPTADGSYARYVMKTTQLAGANACNFEVANNCAGSCVEEGDEAGAVNLVQDPSGKIYATFLVEQVGYTTSASKKTITTNPLDPDCFIFDNCTTGTVCQKSRVRKSGGDERLVIAEVDPALPGLRERLRFKTRRTDERTNEYSVSIRDNIAHVLMRLDKDKLQLLLVHLDR